VKQLLIHFGNPCSTVEVKIINTLGLIIHNAAYKNASEIQVEINGGIGVYQAIIKSENQYTIRRFLKI